MKYNLRFCLHFWIVTKTENEALNIIDKELDRIEQEKSSGITELMISATDSRTKRFMKKFQKR